MRRPPDHTIRVALIDDHPATLLGLQRLIEVHVHAAAPTAAELAHRLGGTRPDAPP